MPLWYGLIFRSTKILKKKKKIVHAQTHTHRHFAKGIRGNENPWQADTSKLQRVYLKKTLNRVQCFMGSPNPQ